MGGRQTLGSGRLIEVSDAVSHDRDESRRLGDYGGRETTLARARGGSDHRSPATRSTSKAHPGPRVSVANPCFGGGAARRPPHRQPWRDFGAVEAPPSWHHTDRPHHGSQCGLVDRADPCAPLQQHSSGQAARVRVSAGPVDEHHRVRTVVLGTGPRWSGSTTVASTSPTGLFLSADVDTSLTNATTFSPTDTMPLTGWATLLMALQSLASLVTVAVIVSRAVSILR